jgi:hypothetical protein
MFDTQTFQSLHPNNPTATVTPSTMQNSAFVVIFFLVLFACCIAILGSVYNFFHESARGSEAEADLELGETAVCRSEVTGWFAETGSGEPLPVYSVEDPLGGPPPYQKAVPGGDLGVFVVEDEDEV